MSFLLNYIDWHYFVAWPKTLVLWRNFTFFPFFYFSIPLHLRTLFSYWKRQKAHMRLGFHFDDFVGVLGFNLTSRIIGAIVRTFTILYGILFMAVFCIIGAIPALIWPIIPFLTIPVYLKRKQPLEIETQKLLTRAKGNHKTLILLTVKSKEGQFIVKRLGLDPKTITVSVIQSEDPGNFTPLEEQLQKKGKQVKFSDLYEVALCTYMPVKDIFSRQHITCKDIYNTAIWYERLHERDEMPLLLDLAKIQALSGIGVNWAYGYTVAFDTFARDMTKRPSPFPFLLGREKEIKEMERILLKTEGNNVLIVGEPGVARHLLVETLAHRSRTGNCEPALSHKRILALDMHSLTASEGSILEVKGLASDIFTEAEQAGNVIVCIDEIDKYVATGEGRIDMTDVFAKFAESNVGIIGITTPGDYHKYIESNTTLSALFDVVSVEPPSRETLTIELELSIVPVLEKKHKIFITYPAITKTIENADRYITSTPFPGKAIELLDETAVYVKTRKKQSIILASHIDEFLSQKLNIPMGDLKYGEKEKLANLEALLHRRVINQEAAVHALASSLRRARLNIASHNKPIGTFLFLGPTGVGKTETAKALASTYFGREDVLLRFDMSQYQKEEGMERLIGSLKLGLAGELTSQLRSKPFSLILLDEIEKADKAVSNLFLTLLDEGYITDSSGKKVDAKNCIVIATSNAGSEFIREQAQIASQGDTLQEAVVEYVQREKLYSPEFLNRFDGVIVFTPLSEGHLREIAKLQLADLNNRLKPKEISIAVTDELVKKLAHIGFDPQFGARAMKRVIAEKIEDQIAQKLLAATVKKGEEMHIEL